MLRVAAIGITIYIVVLIVLASWRSMPPAPRWLTGQQQFGAYVKAANR